jgi:dipeptidyl aminopeptidase/acylaminoacyl peptidase
MGILHSALTPYDNDLYASNLVHLPVLAIHGEEDDNVPVTHSRLQVDLLDSWRGERNTTG